jgi:hypothetical protein
MASLHDAIPWSAITPMTTVAQSVLAFLIIACVPFNLEVLQIPRNYAQMPNAREAHGDASEIIQRGRLPRTSTGDAMLGTMTQREESDVAKIFKDLPCNARRVRTAMR